MSGIWEIEREVVFGIVELIERSQRAHAILDAFHREVVVSQRSYGQQWTRISGQVAVCLDPELGAKALGDATVFTAPERPQWRTALLLALHQLTSGGDTEITPQQVRRALADFMDADDHEKVTAQWVGYRLREFGFERLSKGSSRGSVYAIAADGVLDVLTRYELQVEQVMEGSSDNDENEIPQ